MFEKNNILRYPLQHNTSLYLFKKLFSIKSYNSSTADFYDKGSEQMICLKKVSFFFILTTARWRWSGWLAFFDKNFCLAFFAFAWFFLANTHLHRLVGTSTMPAAALFVLFIYRDCVHCVTPIIILNHSSFDAI